MTVQEILEAHTQSFDWYPCKCGWKPVFDGRGKAVDQHRVHVADVLDKHMQEREVEAWQEGFESGRWYDLDDMEPENPYMIKPEGQANGR